MVAGANRTGPMRHYERSMMGGTLGDAKPEIEAMERVTGNKVRVWEVPDGPIMLDFTTPRPRRERRRKERGKSNRKESR